MATATPSFPFYPQRFLSATNHWPPQAVGAYIRLLLHQWDNIFIPNIEYSIRRITGLEGEDFGFFGLFILEKFKETEPGKLQNAFLETLRDKKNDFIEKQTLNGKKGGRPRKTETQKEPKENPSLPFGESQTKPKEKVIGERRKERGERKIGVPDGLGGFKDIDPPKAKGLPQKPSSLYEACKDLWSNFYKGRNDGVKPLFKSKDAPALKGLITYFKINIAEGITPATSETDEENKVLDSFKFIFSRWDMLKDFERNGIDVSKIYSNINSIIQQQKHGNFTGYGTATGGTKSRPGSAESAQAVFNAIDSIPDRK